VKDENTPPALANALRMASMQHAPQIPLETTTKVAVIEPLPVLGSLTIGAGIPSELNFPSKLSNHSNIRHQNKKARCILARETWSLHLDNLESGVSQALY